MDQSVTCRAVLSHGYSASIAWSGGVSSGSSAAYNTSFNSAGSKTVSVTATNATGSDSHSITITIQAAE